MIKIVKERTREIGTWRSLGYTSSQITKVFALEASILGFAGGLFGIACSLIFIQIINNSGIFFTGGLFVEPVPLKVLVLPTEYVLGIAILTFVCVLAANIATRRQLRDKISENLISN